MKFVTQLIREHSENSFGICGIVLLIALLTKDYSALNVA